MRKELISLVLLCAVGCGGGGRVTPVFRGLPQGLGDTQRQKLAEQVTVSVEDASSKFDSKRGTIEVSFSPTKSTLETLKNAKDQVLGPCLPDGTTYSYYLLRIYDGTGSLIGVSTSSEVPIRCVSGKHDFSSFGGNHLIVEFPANEAVLRDAKQLEFSLWFEVLGGRGTLVSDANQFPTDWRRLSR